MRRLTFAILVTLAAFAAGCGPSDPLERKIAAESATAFSMWRSQANGFLTAAQCKEVDEAAKELKLAVMNNRETTGTDAVEEAMRAKIHDRTVREMLRAAYEAKIKRLEVDLKGLLIAAEQNSRLTTKAGDTESSSYLSGFRERQMARLNSVQEELKAAQDKLAALGVPVTKR